MKKLLARTLFVGAALLSVTTSRNASAQVLFTETPDNVYPAGYLQSLNFANDFTVSGASTMTSVTWWVVKTGSGHSNFTGNFNWRIYGDAAGTPGSVLESGAASVTSALAPAYDAVGSQAFSLTFAVPSLALSPATTYWVGILNYTDDGPGAGTWWMSAPIAGNTLRYDYGAGFVTFPGIDGAMCIRGEEGGDCGASLDTESTPEPASFVLIATGLLGLGVVKTRRKRAA